MQVVISKRGKFLKSSKPSNNTRILIILKYWKILIPIRVFLFRKSYIQILLVFNFHGLSTTNGHCTLLNVRRSQLTQGGLKVASRWPQGGLKVASRWPQGGLKVASRWPQGGLKVASMSYCKTQVSMDILASFGLKSQIQVDCRIALTSVSVKKVSNYEL